MAKELWEKDAPDPRESLRVIQEVIDVAKRNVQENGFHFLLWGVLITVSALGEWSLWNATDFGAPWLVWAIFPPIGGIIALVYEWQRDRAKRPENVVRRWYGQVWLSFVICLVLLLMFGLRYRVPPTPLVMVMAGFATFLSGTLLQFAPLRWGGVALWAGAVACLPLAAEQHGLVMATATVLGYLAPGLMLHRQYRKSHA